MPAAIATAALLVVALVGLPWVRDRSGSLAADRAIILAWAALALVAAWFQVAAVPIGRGSNGKAEPETSASPFRPAALLRSVALAVAAVANLAWSDLASGGFWLDHYRRFGPDDTELRSSSPDVRRRALLRLSEVMQPRLVEAVPRIAGALGDPDPDVRSTAVLALGHVARRMGVAIATLRAEGGVEGRWEPAAREAALSALGDPALRIRSLSGAERRAWIRAAGAIREPANVAVLREVIESGAPRQDVIEAVGALADIPHPPAMAALRVALGSADADVRVLAAWAAGVVARAAVEARAEAADAEPEFRAMEEFLAERLPSMGTQAACAYLELFPRVADMRMTRALLALASPGAMAAVCERVERPNPIGGPDVVVKEGPLADKVIEAMRAVAVGNAELHSFLVAASVDPAWPESIRRRFTKILDDVAARGGR